MNIGVIGAGNMSEAMIAAWLQSRLVEPDEIILADVREDRLSALQRRYGVAVTLRNHEVVSASDVLVLGVKPQQLADMLGALQAAAAPTCLVLSIAAGKRLEWLEERLPSARLVRVMPNIACRTRVAMSAFCAGTRVTAADRSTARSLLEKFGRAMEVPEPSMDAVTAVSGSGPAFFARMLQAMVTAAAAEGLTQDQAQILAAQTMRGTASLLLDGGMSPQELIDAVSSARGVTVAGLDVMDRRRFDGIVKEFMTESIQRSRELAETG